MSTGLRCTRCVSTTRLSTILTTVTGDDTLRAWKVGALGLWMDSNVDVPQMVYRHAHVCEYAWNRRSGRGRMQ